MHVNQLLIALERFDLNGGNGVAKMNKLVLQDRITSLDLNC